MYLVEFATLNRRLDPMSIAQATRNVEDVNSTVSVRLRPLKAECLELCRQPC